MVRDLIGDPSGKTEERQLNSLEVVEAYTERQREQLEKYLDFETKHNRAQMVSNYTWLSDVRAIEFLRDVGKHFSMGYMLWQRVGGVASFYRDFVYRI